ncbi:unnamed protein product [Rotaria sp. Silwood1]|nr:unnamed protein product [Rotaria sp. Silwood1]
MSRDFIGSKIAIITKSQCRYVGTIIGIDSQTSSILLGNVKCFGTENRSGHLTNTHMTDTILPIMQFANSDIEDLKIVDEDQTAEIQQQQSCPMPGASSTLPSSQPPSIHDDPAIVSAVISSSYKDNASNSTVSSRLMHSFHHMTLSDEKSTTQPKAEESRIHSNSGELGPSWSLLSSSKLENNNNNPKPSSQQRSDNKSKFFDSFISDSNNNTNRFQSNRSHQRSSNTHSTQTSRENNNRFNGQHDDNGLPVRQPFFSDDNPYPQKQQQQQQPNRYQNDNMQHKQRYFHNNYRSQKSNQQRYMGGTNIGGNRETFQGNPNDYDDDFDFETSNRKFHKLTSEDELKHRNDLPTHQPLQLHMDKNAIDEHQPIYDKKKSFFDNLAGTEQSDAPLSYNSNRLKNKDTFNNDTYQHYNNRSNGNGYRRSNYNYRQHQHENEDFHYKQHNNNKNGYHYRY